MCRPGLAPGYEQVELIVGEAVATPRRNVHRQTEDAAVGLLDANLAPADHAQVDTLPKCESLCREPLVLIRSVLVVFDFTFVTV